MSAELQEGKDFAILVLKNRLSMVEVNETRSTVQPALDKASQLVIDLSGLEIIDSSGMGLLLQCKQKLDQSQRPMYLLKPQEQIRSLFQLTGISKALKVIDSLEEVGST